MQYTRNRKNKKKGLINQFCCKFKCNNQFDAILLKVRIETKEAEAMSVFECTDFLDFLIFLKIFLYFFVDSIGHGSQNMAVLMTKVLNFVNRSSTITVIFSINFNLIPMPTQQLNQTIPRSYIQKFTQQLTTLSTGVSFQFLRKK
jgi:hypothetical protein